MFTEREACVLKTWQHRLDLVACEHAATRARNSQQPGGVEDVFTCLVRDGRRKPLRKSYTACNTTNNNRLRTRDTRHARFAGIRSRRADNRHADRGNHCSSERGGTSFGVLHVWSRPRHVPSGQMRQASLGDTSKGRDNSGSPSLRRRLSDQGSLQGQGRTTSLWGACSWLSFN